MNREATHAKDCIDSIYVAGSFELESLMQRRFDLQPEVDLEQINEFTRRAPQQVKIAGSK